ncbi:hypothetical protein A9Q84_01015 [Halobacteriovorax marinus]|uniref:Uncharacterized protein n=1 Tax=Halobacteriovorax marinus TaxID=97084 RepID=A0A1Y5FBQ7_9BACT|nr:hypothetical protein A9Q84_01015 [Halobacteriovorax marinus]
MFEVLFYPYYQIPLAFFGSILLYEGIVNANDHSVAARKSKEEVHYTKKHSAYNYLLHSHLLIE